MTGRRPSTLPKIKHKRSVVSNVTKESLHALAAQDQDWRVPATALESLRDPLKQHKQAQNSSNGSWDLELTVGRPIIDFPNRNLTELGLDIVTTDLPLSLGPCGARLAFIVRQIAFTFDDVYKAAAALGSFTRSNLLEGLSGNRLDAVCYRHYVDAVSEVGQKISDLAYPRIPLALACVILTTLEILMQQPHNALIHLQGARSVLGDTEKPSAGASPGASESETRSKLSSLQYDLETLLQALDIHKTGYAVAYGSVWTRSSPTGAVQDLPLACEHLFSVTQECMEWMGRNFRMAFLLNRQTPESTLEQMRLLKPLSAWLENLNAVLMRRKQTSNVYDPRAASIEREHLLRLRMLCTSTFIRVFQFLEPSQESYAAHALRFQQIILDAEEILLTGRNRKVLARHKPYLLSKTLTLGPGLVEPLFLVAQNYRSKPWRRRAIACLLQFGIEGPWIGMREAALSSRMVQYEESWPAAPAEWHGLPRGLQKDRQQFGSDAPYAEFTDYVPEEALLRDCITRFDGDPQTARSCSVMFLRCAEVSEMTRRMETINDPYGDVFRSANGWRTWEEILTY